MGILDDISEFMKTPEGVGIASTIAGGMAGARKGAPWNTLGRAGMSGLMGYSNAQEAIQQKAQNDQMRQWRDLQMGKMTSEIEADKRLQEWKASQTNLPEEVRAGAIPYAEYWKKKNPEPKLETIYDSNGREIKGYANPDGSFVPVGGAKSGVTAINLGGKTMFADPTMLQGKSLDHTMTPGERASNQLGWANNRIAAQNATAPVFNESAGGWLYKPTQQNPSGAVVNIPGLAGKPLTEIQGKATGFASRMAEAEKILSDPSMKEVPGAIENIAGSLPWIGDYAANSARDASRQQYVQAKQNWKRANLRLESGAAIGKEEDEGEDKTYFPQQGDSAEVIAQKAQARRVAQEAVSKQAGNQFKNQEPPKMRSRQFTLDDGSKALATLAEDGNYYVTKGGKKYRVEE